MNVSQDVALTTLARLAASPVRLSAHEIAEGTPIRLSTMKNLVLPRLLEAGYIFSVHMGGYGLARPAGEISVIEVLEAFGHDGESGYSEASRSVVRAMTQAVAGMTVADLARTLQGGDRGCLEGEGVSPA